MEERSRIFDMSKVHNFVLEGDPIAWSRAGVNNGRFYDKQKHEKLVVGINIANQFKGKKLLEGPLAFQAVFYFRIPKTRSKNLMGAFHTQTPDVDNCAKFLMDVCSGLLYRDDCIIANLNIRKVWSDKAYTEFSLVELE